MKVKIVAVSVAVLGILGVFGYFGLALGETMGAKALNLGLFTLAAVVGWLAGFLLTPYNQAERSRFPKYSKGLLLFLSGYGLSKLDPVLTTYLEPTVLADEVAAFRLLAFIGILLAVLLLVYVYRTYLPGADEKAP